MNEEPTILTARATASITVPVDLSSELDRPEVPLMGQHEVEVTLDSPLGPLELVNALAVTLDSAVRSLTEQPDA